MHCINVFYALNKINYFDDFISSLFTLDALVFYCKLHGISNNIFDVMLVFNSLQ